MAKGKDERHNPNRKVSRPLSVEDEIARAFMTDEELALQDDDERYARNKDEPGALLPSQQTGNRYEY